MIPRGLEKMTTGRSVDTDTVLRDIKYSGAL